MEVLAAPVTMILPPGGYLIACRPLCPMDIRLHAERASAYGQVNQLYRQWQAARGYERSGSGAFGCTAGGSATDGGKVRVRRARMWGVLGPCRGEAGVLVSHA